MRVLTLTQPWATLVAIGEKRYETRDWACEPGPLLIHAGKNLGPVGGKRGLRALCSRWPYRQVLAQHFGVGEDEDVSKLLPRGVVLCAVDVVGCYRVPGRRSLGEQSGVKPTTYDSLFGDYGAGRYAWALTNLHNLPEPIRARGHQKLWRLDMEDPRP